MLTKNMMQSQFWGRGEPLVNGSRGVVLKFVTAEEAAGELQRKLLQVQTCVCVCVCVFARLSALGQSCAQAPDHVAAATPSRPHARTHSRTREKLDRCMLMLGEVHTIACMLFVLQVHARLGSGRRQDGDDVHQAVVMARQQLEAAEAAAAADRQAVADALAAAAAAADPPHKAQDKGVCSQVPHLRPVEIAAAPGADTEPAVAGQAPSTQVFLSLPPPP